MRSFDYIRPATVAEAIAALAAFGSDARVLTGGTDLVVGLREGKVAARAVVDIKRVADLSHAIEVDGDWVEVGAGVTMTALAADARMRSLYPALCEAAEVVGSLQIRNRATLVGNVCNASPAADTVPVLAAFGASVRVVGPAGERRVSVADFVEGNRRVDLAAGELVAAVRLPMADRPIGSGFARITRRRGVDLATVNACCTIDADGHATFALGAVSPRPLVVRHAIGADMTARAVMLDAVAAVARPISDVRGSAAFRAAMVRVLAARAFDRALDRSLSGDTP